MKPETFALIFVVIWAVIGLYRLFSDDLESVLIAALMIIIGLLVALYYWVN